MCRWGSSFRPLAWRRGALDITCASGYVLTTCIGLVSGSLVVRFSNRLRYLSPGVDVVIVWWLLVLLNFKRWDPKWLWFIQFLLHFRFFCLRYSLITSVYVSCMFNYVTVKICVCHLLIFTRTFSHTYIFRIRTLMSLSKFLILLNAAVTEYVHSSSSVCCRWEFGDNLKINYFLALPKAKSLTNGEPRQIKDAIQVLLWILN